MLYCAQDGGIAKIAAWIRLRGCRAAVVALLLVQPIIGEALHASALAEAAALEMLGLAPACSQSGTVPGSGLPDVSHQDDCCSLPGGCAVAAPPDLSVAEVLPPRPIAVASRYSGGAPAGLIASRYRTGHAARAPPAPKA
jgi:hypothetical protein